MSVDGDVQPRAEASWAGWCCPVCAASLAPRGAGLFCAAEERWFATHEGVHRLLPEDRRRELQPFIEVLQHARTQSPRRVDGRRMDEVEAALASHLGAGPWKILQVFAGTAVEATRLVAAGHRVAAVDPSADGVVGLGASKLAERAEADLEALPVEAGHFDAVLAAAALHQAPRLSRTLVELRRVTRKGGLLIAFDSPVFRRRRDGEVVVEAAMKAQARRYGIALPREQQPGYLVLTELPDLFRAAGWRLLALDWPGWAAELAQDVASTVLRRAPRGRRPLIVARRER